MKKQRYIVEIEMPDEVFISAGWLKDIIQTDCDVEDESRKKVTVQETSIPSNLDEAANNYGIDIRLGYPRVMDETDKFIYNAFKAGAEWMAGQGVTADFEVNKLAVRAWLTANDEATFQKSIYDNFEAGDKVSVQIRKV